MRWVRIVLPCCALGLAASLLLARIHPFGDAGLYAAKTAPRQIMEHDAVPPEARAILTAKCADCHSMQTRPHFYGRFAPASWLMERDIVKGRKQMNLSSWDSYSADQQEIFKAKMVQETKSHAMPLLQYWMIHWDARISDADVRTFAQWAHGGVVTEAESGVAGDAVKGKAVYEKRCTGCHAMDQDREGPRLRGVFGRVSGGVAGFPYSPALKQARIVWDGRSLERWLADPDAVVPGNNMDFHVASAEERRDLVRFMKEGAGN
jgi:cytochrome c